MWQGEALCRPDEPVTHAYFLNRGTVSLISVFENGGSVITITDRAGLEAASCECYPLVKKEFSRLVGA